MAESKKQIIIYSDDSSVRAAVISALGKRAAKDLPEHEIHEFATGPALRAYVDTKNLAGDFRADLFILDGEAAKRVGWAWLANLRMRYSTALRSLSSRDAKRISG